MRVLQLLCVLLALSLPSFGANILINGSFESPALPDQSGGATGQFGSISGWDILSGGGPGANFEIHRAPFLFSAGADGSQWAELDVNGNTTIGQLLATIIGNTYTISFSVAARPGFGDSVVVVSFGGQTFTTPAVSNTSGWTTFTFTAVATSTSTLFSVAAGGASNGGSDLVDNFIVDDGSVGSVPEPSTFGMLGLGGVAFAMLRRRRA